MGTLASTEEQLLGRCQGQHRVLFLGQCVDALCQRQQGRAPR